MITVTKYYCGLSSDTKPTTDTPPGSIFIETDTKQKHIYSSTGGWTIKDGEEFDRTVYPIRGQGTTGGVQYTTSIATEAASSGKAIWTFDTSDYFSRLAGSLAWVSYEINMQLMAESTSADLTWKLQARDKDETWIDMSTGRTIVDVGTSYVARTIQGYLDIQDGVSLMPFEMQLVIESNESDEDVISSWTETTGDLENADEIHCLFTSTGFNPGRLYAGTDSENGKIFVSTGDDNWTNTGVLQGEYQVHDSFCLFEFGDYLVAGTSQNVNYNTGTDTWQICNFEPKNVLCFAEFNDMLYAGKNDGSVYYTTQPRNMSAFEESGDLSGATCVYSLSEFDGKLYAGTTSTVYVSTGDDNWAVTTGTGLTDATTVRALFEFNSKLYAGTEPNGDIFVTTGDGNWAEAGTLTTGTTAVYCFGEFNDKLFAGTGATGDVFRFDEATTGWTETGELASALRTNALIEYNDKLYAGTYPNGNAFVAELESGEGYGRVKNDTVIRAVGDVV